MFRINLSKKKNCKHRTRHFLGTSLCFAHVFLLSPLREKVPFHHVTTGLLYKENYLSRSLSGSDSDALASITVEELGGKASQLSVWLRSCLMLNVHLKGIWLPPAALQCLPPPPPPIGNIHCRIKMSRWHFNIYCTSLIKPEKKMNFKMMRTTAVKISDVTICLSGPKEFTIMLMHYIDNIWDNIYIYI